MPQSGHLWYHVVLNTHRTWLPGDRRGFRSRDGHIHSSGDYRNPPPENEHAGFRNYHQHRSGEPVRIPRSLQAVICSKLVEKIHSQNYRVLAAAVDDCHAHLLVELPSDRRQIKKVVGLWKQAASHAVRDQMPGRVWAEDCDPVPIEDRPHQIRTYRYILGHASQGAVTWRSGRGS